MKNFIVNHLEHIIGYCVLFVIFVLVAIIYNYDKNKHNKTEKIHIYEFDSCEYIGNLEGTPNTHWLTHKGNCKFCEKRKLTKTQ